nr:hypothetical protein [Butyrivibrio sp.]
MRFKKSRILALLLSASITLSQGLPAFATEAGNVADDGVTYQQTYESSDEELQLEDTEDADSSGTASGTFSGLVISDVQIDSDNIVITGKGSAEGYIVDVYYGSTNLADDINVTNGTDGTATISSTNNGTWSGILKQYMSTGVDIIAQAYRAKTDKDTSDGDIEGIFYGERFALEASASTDTIGGITVDETYKELVVSDVKIGANLNYKVKYAIGETASGYLDDSYNATALYSGSTYSFSSVLTTTGTYTFTLQSVSGDKYTDIAQATYEYTAEAYTQLDPVDNITWSGKTTSWTEVENADQYNIAIYDADDTLVASATTENTSYNWSKSIPSSSSSKYTLPYYVVVYADDSTETYLTSDPSYKGQTPTLTLTTDTTTYSKNTSYFGITPSIDFSSYVFSEDNVTVSSDNEECVTAGYSYDTIYETYNIYGETLDKAGTATITVTMTGPTTDNGVKLEDATATIDITVVDVEVPSVDTLYALSNRDKTLASVDLPEGFEWKTPSTSLVYSSSPIDYYYAAIYTSGDYSKTVGINVIVERVGAIGFNSITGASSEGYIDLKTYSGKAMEASAYLKASSSDDDIALTGDGYVADKANYTVTSSNKSVATVAITGTSTGIINYTVTPLKAGTTKITVTYTDKDNKVSKVTASETIKVIEDASTLPSITSVTLNMGSTSGSVERILLGDNNAKREGTLTVVGTNLSKGIKITSSDSKVFKIGKVTTTTEGSEYSAAVTAVSTGTAVIT